MSSATPAPHCPACGADTARGERTLAGYPLVRCARCGLVYVWPRPRRDESEASYASGRRGADSTEDVPTSSAQEEFETYAAEATPYQREARRRFLQELHRLQPVRRLLDFGCGSGHWLALAREALACEIFGIELNPVAQVGAERFGFVLHAGPLETCPFPPASFDLVLCTQVLEHLPEPRDELERLASLLVPGGLLFVEVPHYGSLSIRLGRDAFRNNTPPGHLNYFMRGSLSSLLRRCGFEPIRVLTTGLAHGELLGRSNRREAPDRSPPIGAREPRHVGGRFGTAAPGSAMRARLGLLRGLDRVLSWPGWGMQLAVVARRISGQGLAP